MVEKDDFNVSAKSIFFDKVFDMYFNRNFGMMSKTDFEVFLFSEFIENCLIIGENIDDYTLSKQLGISQSRVRSLKERKELKYPRGDEFKWKEVFAENVKTAKYDKDNHRVKMIIQDINVMTEVRHFIEESNWYDEPTLNKRMLQIPLDCFVDLCSGIGASTEFDKAVKDNIRKISNEKGISHQIKDLATDYSREALYDLLKKGSVEIVKLLLGCIPLGGAGQIAIQNLLEKM